MIYISQELCNGCGECVAVCPHLVLGLSGKPKRAVAAAEERCMECGACGLNCPQDAITGNFGVGCFACMTKEKLTGRKSAGACAC